MYCEEVNVDALAASVGTPFYLYSKRTLADHYVRFAETFSALQPQICYSIKNCGNLHLIKVLVNLGAGIDVVSGGELSRALEAGADPKKIVFAGVGKTSAEIRQALEAGIGWLNVESEAEFENARAIAAELRCRARVALRVNPHVYDPGTPQKCATGRSDTKFGVDIDHVPRFFEAYGRDPWLTLAGLHIHLGSPIYSSDTYVRGIEKLLGLLPELEKRGHAIEMLDIGGGYIAHYDGSELADWGRYAADIVPLLKPFVERGGKVIMEPGRAISANAGVLITRVQYVKRTPARKFTIVDAGMSHCIRPTLYGAYHFIWATRVPPGLVPPDRRSTPDLPGLEVCDVVGPVCESSDYLAQDRLLPPVERGELLCVFTAGAYSMAMASQYNTIPRPPEVLVDGKAATVIRRRETYDDLVALEREPQAIDF